MTPAPLAPDWGSVRLFAMDVDGTLTDGGLHFNEQGAESKAFHVRDGYGIVQLRRTQCVVAWISGRMSLVTALRARELKVPHLIQPEDDKAAALNRLAAKLQIPLSQVAYIGDDTNDLGALRVAGIPCAPADAHPDVLAVCRHVTRATGGRGAVREICDLILSAQPSAK